jgi:hypothetical protein
MGALIAGCVFASLTWIVFGDVEQILGLRVPDPLFHVLSFLVLPGMFLSMLASGNVHGGEIWVAVLANFGIYFGLAYLLIGIRKTNSRKP